MLLFYLLFSEGNGKTLAVKLETTHKSVKPPTNIHKPSTNQPNQPQTSQTTKPLILPAWYITIYLPFERGAERVYFSVSSDQTILAVSWKSNRVSSKYTVR